LAPSEEETGIYIGFTGVNEKDGEETKPPKEKQDAKEKSSGSRRGNRYHPYKDKHGGEKKGAHRNRVFISNIPYDMKWQAIKDLMREKVHFCFCCCHFN
uniref:Myelin expression factor 2 n=1 Tax=Seriola lalandi dorsalis TaxID=1841481 RepID=A0A3B4YJ04_SERLL